MRLGQNRQCAVQRQSYQGCALLPVFPAALTPLSLQLQDIECFRYRVEDVWRSLTKRVVAAAVARDLQQQLLNSRKLKEFFERNPRDKEVLKRACKQLKVSDNAL